MLLYILVCRQLSYTAYRQVVCWAGHIEFLVGILEIPSCVVSTISEHFQEEETTRDFSGQILMNQIKYN